jgi:enamine deaminase RidA (YjgF/YER057c/UK114 family)
MVPEGFRSIYSHAVEVKSGARLLFVSGQVGMAPDGSLADGFEAQLNQAIDNVEALLASAGMSKDNIVKANYFLTRAADLPALGAIRRQRWAKTEAEAVTVLVVAALARPEWLIEMEVFAADWNA